MSIIEKFDKINDEYIPKCNALKKEVVRKISDKLEERAFIQCSISIASSLVSVIFTSVDVPLTLARAISTFLSVSAFIAFSSSVSVVLESPQSMHMCLFFTKSGIFGA